jgi:hypothetical protein
MINGYSFTEQISNILDAAGVFHCCCFWVRIEYPKIRLLDLSAKPLSKSMQRLLFRFYAFAVMFW